jgi:KUP system potassium uptake protein
VKIPPFAPFRPSLIGLRTVHDGDDLKDRPRSPSEVPGTAVFMTAQPTGTPPALVHNRHNTVLHKRVVVLTVATAQVPTCAAEERRSIQSLGHDMFIVRVQYGFMEDPSVSEALERARVRASD